MIARQIAKEQIYDNSVCCMKNDVGNVVADAVGVKDMEEVYAEAPKC